MQIASLESFVAVDVPHRKNAAKFFLFLMSLSHVILRTYGRGSGAHVGLVGVGTPRGTPRGTSSVLRDTFTRDRQAHSPRSSRVLAVLAGTESARRSSLSLLCLTDRIWLAGFMSADMGAYLLYAGLVTPLGTHGYSRACLL